MLPVPSEGEDFSTLWRLCIESPSQPKLASSLHNKRLSYWRLTGYGRNDERGARRHRHLERRIYEKIISRCFILLPLAGEVPRSGKGGGERSEPITRVLIMLYDTESQSRNVLASPLGEEGHEVAKGCTRVRMIMILDVDVTAEGGIIKLIARRAIHHPLNQPAKGRPNPLNLLNLHAEGVSNASSTHRKSSFILIETLEYCNSP